MGQLTSLNRAEHLVLCNFYKSNSPHDAKPVPHAEFALIGNGLIFAPLILFIISPRSTIVWIVVELAI